MDLTAVFSKTAKGHDEILSRRNRLPFRVRALLIMVDGNRTGNELVSDSIFGPEAEQHLEALLGGQFVVAQNVEPTTLAAADDISLAKRYVIQTLHELLGPQATPFAVVIEKATTAQQLLYCLETLREPLIIGAGKEKADEFHDKMSLVLA